jgi:hypothetical protein
MSTLQIHKVKYGVSKIVLKFPHDVIFRTRNYGTLLLAFLFFIMVFWKSLSTWSLATNLDVLGVSYSLPASQVEAVEVEISLSSQGSQKVNVEKSSITFSSRSVSITFKSSEASNEVHPGSIEAFAKLLFVSITNVKCCTLSFLNLLPITINSLDRTDVIIVSVRPYDAMTPLRRLFPQLCSRR